MTALPSNFENIISNLLFRGFQGYFRGFVSTISQVAPNLSLFKDNQTFVNESLQGRLDAIAKARETADATLEQINELRRQTEQSQIELALALEQIKTLQKAKPDATQETEALEKIATIDTSSFRETVGAPSVLDVWRERAYGFGSGFVGCILTYIILKILGAILF